MKQLSKTSSLGFATSTSTVRDSGEVELTGKSLKILIEGEKRVPTAAHTLSNIEIREKQLEKRRELI